MDTNTFEITIPIREPKPPWGYTVEKNAIDFCSGNYEQKVNPEQWKETFQYLDKNYRNMKCDSNGVHLIWTQFGRFLREEIQDDKLVIKVLSLYLPGYSGEDKVLYRGESGSLYKKGMIGFCWTPDINVARKFANNVNIDELGGVLLKANASSKAILAEPNEHSSVQMREYEYTCNPALLTHIETLELFPLSR